MEQFEIAEWIAKWIAKWYTKWFIDFPSRITVHNQNELVRKWRVLVEKHQWIESGKFEGIVEGPLTGIREIEAGCNLNKRKK